MRRMNSMLLGHQGASGRTDCMYLEMARSVAGSPRRGAGARCAKGPRCHPSRRVRPRLGRTASRSRSRGSAARRSGLERADAGRQIDDAGELRVRQPAHERLRRGSATRGRAPWGRIRRGCTHRRPAEWSPRGGCPVGLELLEDGGKAERLEPRRPAAREPRASPAWHGFASERRRCARFDEGDATKANGVPA